MFITDARPPDFDDSRAEDHATNTSKVDHQTLIEQLSESSAKKRIAAAKKMRRSKDPAFCDALIAAVEREITKRDTFEARQELLWALIDCGDERVLALIDKLSKMDPSPVYRQDLGHLYIKFARTHPTDPEPIIKMMNGAPVGMASGVIRGIAYLRLKLEKTAVDSLRNYLQTKSVDADDYFYAACGAAGWPDGTADDFLNEWCMSDYHLGARGPTVAHRVSEDRLKDAINCALQKKYYLPTSLPFS